MSLGDDETLDTFRLGLSRSSGQQLIAVYIKLIYINQTGEKTEK